ncbi:glycosyltransferase family A protein [Mesobacterium sp. TK19101]|uniref:Glycosyltransferase family A protein n=1 Tax=Mesobacterium hydrothermale TaxID=3111907 RepID=A0ABU6HNW6_9RHOB|nr:glycosyltransferase family A protein [Mesobacterium sp. TK19101]MEC3863138.1 glycosyltransferase family A protein [Mesobacterium sp. TK19101]
MLVVSLSSIPSRFPYLPDTLNAILRQTHRPDHIIVYIPKRYRRFPDYDGHLPDIPEGVEIRRPEDDLGPATKVLFAARDFSRTEEEARTAQILFCDDDMIYQPDWIEGFMQARARRPEGVIAAHGFDLPYVGLPRVPGGKQPRVGKLPRALDMRYRLRKLKVMLEKRRFKLERAEKPPRTLIGRSGYADVFEGFSGVLVRPYFFDDAAYDIPEKMWTVDDIWLSGIVAKNGHEIWVEKDLTRYQHTMARHHDALNRSEIEGLRRGAANTLCAEYMQKTFGIWQ